MITSSILLTVTSAGTPQQFTTDVTIRGYRIDFYPKVGNTKRSVVGTLSGMAKSTLVGCIAELGKCAADTSPIGWTLEDGSSGEGNQFRASDYWGDVDASNESILMVVHTR